MKPHSDLKCSRVANEKTNKCKVVKSLKPLVNFKFYLDIEKHNISLKIETKIRELGGSIEFFLTKDVTHFITDKVLEKDTGINSPQTPSTPQTPLSNYSEVGSNASVGNDPKTGVKIKSRADAMLQRARKGTTESDRPSIVNKSPTQVAKNWGKPIWHTEYAIKYFEKVYAAIKDHYKGNLEPKGKHKVGNAKVLKGNFIKIESFQKHYRPYYQFLKGTWPTINLKFCNSIGAFYNSNDQFEKDNKTVRANGEKLPEPNKSKESSMTRKNRSKHIRVQQNSRISSEKQCGFCEICRVEYDVLTLHLKTDEHVNFAKNDKNFIELDSLIKSSANVNKFLSINKTLFNSSECELFPKRSKRNATNRMLHNSQSDGIDLKSSTSEGKKSFSDTRNTRQSISSRQSMNRHMYRESKVEVSAVVRSRRESVKKINYAEPGEDEENSDDAIFEIQRKRKVTKETDVKVKSEDADFKPKRPISVLYKVVETKDQQEKKEPLTESNSEQPTSIIVKFKKIRQTELTVLNGEAENFMFPRKVSSELSTDVERQTTSDSRTQSSELSSSEKIVGSPKRKHSLVAQCVEENRESSKRKKSNMSSLNCKPDKVVHSEKEAGNQSQRFQSAPVQSRGRKKLKKKSINNNDAVTSISTPEDGMGEQDSYNLESILKNELGQYKFAFERVPSSEPWYDVFNRQDECKERIFEYYGSTVYRKLPYEMGPLPPLPKNCYCISNRNGNSPLEKPMSVETEKTIASKSNPIDVDRKELKLKLNSKERSASKAASLLSMEMPRKSPREHPSTLAILSCLIQQKDETKTSPSVETTTILEDLPPKSEPEANVKVVPNETINMEISPQIGENVKRLRRGEKLLESKKLKNEVVEPSKDVIVPKKRNHVGRPRKHFGIRPKKPIEVNMNDKKLYQKEDKFVDVHRLKNEIDLYLSQPLNDWDICENESIVLGAEEVVDTFTNELDLGELIFDRNRINETNNFRTHTNKTIANKLRLYKMFAINKKTKVNKTGWPKKRRVLTRQQNNIKMPNLNGLASVELTTSSKFDDKTPNDVTISTQSPITPPETDIEEKVECEPSAVVVCRDENTNLTYASDRADNSDIFTVSSDSLDTVLDVGSQIKTEIQKEIIANRKCKVNLSTKLPPEIKIRKSCRISFRKGNPFLHRKRRNIKLELADIDEIEGSSCSSSLPHSNDNVKVQKSSSSLSSPISPRRLRKPRGRWYRER